MCRHSRRNVGDCLREKVLFPNRHSLSAPGITLKQRVLIISTTFGLLTARKGIYVDHIQIFLVRK